MDLIIIWVQMRAAHQPRDASKIRANKGQAVLLLLYFSWTLALPRQQWEAVL